jgi:hypothetical protein
MFISIYEYFIAGHVNQQQKSHKNKERIHQT